MSVLIRGLATYSARLVAKHESIHLFGAQLRHIKFCNRYRYNRYRYSMKKELWASWSVYHDTVIHSFFKRLTCTMISRDIRLLNTVHSGKYLLCTSPTTAPQVSLQDLGLRCLAESDAITAMSSCTDTPVSRMNSFIGGAVRSNGSHCDSKAGPVLALVFSWLRSQISVHRPFECTLKKLCNLLRGTDVHEVTASSFCKSTP